MIWFHVFIKHNLQILKYKVGNILKFWIWLCFGSADLNQMRSASHSGGILDRSSLQNCFGSFVFSGGPLCFTLLTPGHSIEVGTLGHSKRRIFFCWSNFVALHLRVSVLLQRPSSVELHLMRLWFSCKMSRWTWEWIVPSVMAVMLWDIQVHTSFKHAAVVFFVASSVASTWKLHSS